MSDATIYLKATRGFSLNLRELWQYRELFYFMIWRYVKVRYKQTFLGVVWVILQPLLTMAVFTLFFGRLAGMPSDGVPFPLFALSGLVPWLFFSSGFNKAANSLVSETNLIKKVYCPRLIIPLSGVLSVAFDLFLSIILLMLMIFWYSYPLTWQLAYAPLVVLYALVTTAGIGTLLGALNVQYRDITQMLPFLSQIWMFVSPVVYPLSMLPERWHRIYALNPMVGVCESFRWTFLGKETSGEIIAISLTVSLVIFAASLYVFRRMERRFADVV